MDRKVIVWADQIFVTIVTFKPLSQDLLHLVVMADLGSRSMHQYRVEAEIVSIDNGDGAGH
ncbi:hypothetical protein KBY67_00765 [Synechococcus sp. RedBA-s]|nr:hypothetical protein [Synechococcus sp. RedBA-s]